MCLLRYVFVIVQLLLLVGIIRAADVTKIERECLTTLGTKSLKHVPTKTITVTKRFPAIATSTFTSTSTLKAAVVSVIQQEISLSTVINTAVPFSNTVLVTETPLTTVTSTSTSTTIAFATDTISTTITIVPDPFTISAGSSFLPLATQISNAGHMPYRRQAKTSKAKSKRRSRYPNKVVCRRRVNILPIATSTIVQSLQAAPITKINTETVVQTTTSLVIPASVDVISTTMAPTRTITETDIEDGPTSTSTILSTTSFYSLTAQQTYYQACQPDNDVSKIDGAPLAYATHQVIGGFGTSYTATSPLDCCQKCAVVADVYVAYYEVVYGYCYCRSAAVCPGTFDVAYGPVGSTRDANHAFSFGCGRLRNLRLLT